MTETNVLPRVADEFLVASRNRRHDRETQLSVTHYFTDAVTTVLSQVGVESARDAERVPLGTSAAAGAGFTDVIGRRRSVREFTGGELSLRQLAFLLRCGGSESAEVDALLSDDSTVPLRLRTAPSGGGLYPVEMWVAARGIGGLRKGVYRYLPRADELELWSGETSVDAVLESCVDNAGGIDLKSTAAVLLFVAQPWRSMRKYGPRGMRFVLHETGAIAQNVHLAATALEVGSVDYSSYYDDETHAALDVDGVFRAVVHMVLLGCID
ncbi:SagB/ThcOx family dehydrogenase [Lentzea sp. NPDC051838]|uniref:SagB/ThcOx family dehydrogenase n=1 Tax=Lentzea sp. NPDC051838 TaxID=3154849 RepID=UPI003427B503